MWNKFCVSSWLNTDINKLRCTVRKKNVTPTRILAYNYLKPRQLYASTRCARSSNGSLTTSSLDNTARHYGTPTQHRILLDAELTKKLNSSTVRSKT